MRQTPTRPWGCRISGINRDDLAGYLNGRIKETISIEEAKARPQYLDHEYEALSKRREAFSEIARCIQ